MAPHYRRRRRDSDVAPTNGARVRYDRSEDAERKSRRDRGAGLFAASQIVCAYGLRREYRFGRLRVSADDDRLAHLFKAPAGADALDLAHRVRAVAACADERRIRASLDAV